MLIRCSDCGGTLLYEQTEEGYKVFHSCKDGKQVRDMLAVPLKLNEAAKQCNEEMEGRCDCPVHRTFDTEMHS